MYDGTRAPVNETATRRRALRRAVAGARPRPYTPSVTHRVRFRSFWAEFDPEAFFMPLIRGAVGSAEVVPTTGPCDLEIVSVFREPEPATGVRRLLRPITPPLLDRRQPAEPGISPRDDARVSIWFSGENVRPPQGPWDRYWSFEATSQVGRTQHLPLWWLLFPELLAPIRVEHSAENRLGRELRIAEVMSPRVSDIAQRPKFACMFTSGPEPMRMRVAEALSSLGEVDVYGQLTGRAVATKQEVARDYQFMICLENDAYPGYVTEKAFDAWACGTIPIWGGIDRDGDLNPQALINVHAETSLDSVVQRVGALLADADELTAMAQRPLLVRRPSLDAIRSDLAALVS